MGLILVSSTLTLTSCAWMFLTTATPDRARQNNFIVAGDNGVLKNSLDGESWSSDVFGPDQHWNGISVVNHQALAFGMNGLLASSSTGELWNVLNTKDTRIWIYDLTYKHKKYVAVGMGGTIIYSPDSFTWFTLATVSPEWLTSVAASTDSWVAVGSNGTILVSNNATSWHQESSPTSAWLTQVRYLNQQFIAVGSEGTLLVSNDGSNWQLQSLPTTTWLYSVGYGHGTLVAAGQAGKIWCAPANHGWQAAVITPPTTLTIHSLIFAKDKFLAVGDDGLLLRSTDGCSWQQLPPASNVNLYSIGYLHASD